MKREKLEKLATETNYPCVTISMNTNRTYPANQKDTIVLKTLLEEAKGRVIKEFGKRPVIELIGKINHLIAEINVNDNLDSLHIFLSNSTKEIVRSTWPTVRNMVHVSESFAVKPLVKLFNRTEEYLILILTQSNVKLLKAVNDGVVCEIKNDDFPFVNNADELADTEAMNDAKQHENQTSEFFNRVDKALVKVNSTSEMKCVVISTSDNYNRLMKVSDKPAAYLGWTNMNPASTTANHSVAGDAWLIVKARQVKAQAEAIKEVQDAVGQGNVITELS